MTDEIQKTENKMTDTPTGKLLFMMSWPAILSMIIQAMYNIVDTIFVSYVGEQAVAAVTYIFPINMLMISFAVGTGVGINSLISRRLGARRYDEANDAASHGYMLGVCNWIAFALFGIFFAGAFVRLFTQTPYIVENATLYLRITSIGCLFIMIQVINEKLLQATGNMILPMVCSLTGGIMNIILDPLFIFGIGPFPEMGVTGAAVATVLGQLLSFILGTALVFGREHAVKITFKGFRPKKTILKDIYGVAAPAILMQAIGSVMNFGMNMIIGKISETAIAVFGVYFRLQSFIFMPVIGINQGSLPILGFNYGARNKERFMSTYKKSILAAFIIMGIGFIIFQLFPRELLSIFNASDEMYEIGEHALRLISICFIPAAYGVTTSNVFQATGHGTLSLWSSLIRQLVGILPLAFILTRYYGLDGAWASFALAEVLGTIYLISAFIWLYKKEIRDL